MYYTAYKLVGKFGTQSQCCNGYEGFPNNCLGRVLNYVYITLTYLAIASIVNVIVNVVFTYIQYIQLYVYYLKSM